MMMSHHNDLRRQQLGLFEDHVDRISRAEVLFHREIPVGKLRGCASQDGSCERCLRVCERIGQAIGRDTAFATGRQCVGRVDNA